jgi:Icc-related predicted phosphoesterase
MKENKKPERGKKEEGKKLKILAAGDIHGDSSLIKKLAERAKIENVDLVILTGDITYANTEMNDVISPFAKINKQVLLIPGNHEPVSTIDFLSEVYPNVKNLHGYYLTKGNIGIFGAGGANIGIFQQSEKSIYDLLKKGSDKLKTMPGIVKRMMITHVHPANSKMEKFTEIFPGSTGVTRAIKKLQPDIALCSHVHEAEGIEEKIGKTKVINVGRKGKIIEI